MIINHEEKKIVRSSDFEHHEFKVDVSVLSILRNSLYSRKAEAACRETACNAADAHIEAGISETPIEITLPSLFEPVFKVRDYGNSMSDEVVRDIYSYYGKSTKRDSNQAIGGFGIGKLSPLCLAPAFQLTCIQHGYKRIYTIYVNEQNIDQIDLIFEGETDERGGTEVSFGVKPAEIPQFKEACQKIFRFWPTYPIIHNSSDYKKEVVEYHLLKPARWGFLKNGDTCLVSGPIAYNLDESQIPNLSDIQRNILKKNLAIFAGIGDVNLQASRESIAYTPKTIKYLQNKICEIEREIIDEVKTKLSSLKTELDGRRFFRNILTDLGELSVISDLAKNTIKVVVNGENIVESFFRLPQNGIRLYEAQFERNRRSYNSQYKANETDIFDYLSAEKPINGCNRLFYDLKCSKRGRIRNLCKHYVDGKSFGITQQIYVFQPLNLQQLKDYCVAKGIDFAQFQDVNTTIVLPKKVRTPSEKKTFVSNCKIYDPEEVYEEEGEETMSDHAVYAVNIDYQAVESGYFLYSHYGKLYYDAAQTKALGVNISNVYAFLKESDKEFADNPIIHIVPVKNFEKVENNKNFKRIGAILSDLLTNCYSSAPKQKLNVRDCNYFTQLIALKNAVNKGEYVATGELCEIIELLDFGNRAKDIFADLRLEFGVSRRSVTDLVKEKEAANTKIGKYFNRYPVVKDDMVSGWHWEDRARIKQIIHYLALIDQENSKKDLAIELISA